MWDARCRVKWTSTAWWAMYSPKLPGGTQQEQQQRKREPCAGWPCVCGREDVAMDGCEEAETMARCVGCRATTGRPQTGNVHEIVMRVVSSDRAAILLRVEVDLWVDRDGQAASGCFCFACWAADRSCFCKRVLLLTSHSLPCLCVLFHGRVDVWPPLSSITGFRL